MKKNKWFLNGGRGSGRTFRLLCETYENKIADLQHKLDTLQGYLDHDIEYDMDKTIQELRKENAELRAKESFVGDQNRKLCDQQLRIEVLEAKNAELKKEWQEQVQKATDEGYARTLQTMQLTKAKDHIKKLLDCLKQDTNDPQTNYYVCQYMDKAEQFLSEVEKCGQ